MGGGVEAASDGLLQILGIGFGGEERWEDNVFSPLA